MLRIAGDIQVPLTEIEITAVRAQGPGGQNVNKVSTAVHLRFDIHASSLPDRIKQRLLKRKDRRISKEGVIVIQAQRYKSREKNRADALQRLESLIRRSMQVPRKRVPTKPKPISQAKRVDRKVRRGRLKVTRKKPISSDF